MSASFESLLHEVRACTACRELLPQPPNPLVQAHPEARLLIIGQAPGRRAHLSATTWNDSSGDRLCAWLGISKAQFYNRELVAFMPMGFCFPGTGKAGDLAPRPECAPLWHDRLRGVLPNIKLTLLIGQFAQTHYLGTRRQASLTKTVRAWKEYVPLGFLPLVHPSPRNQGWLRKNPWFEEELVPFLQKTLVEVITPGAGG